MVNGPLLPVPADLSELAMSHTAKRDNGGFSEGHVSTPYSLPLVGRLPLFILIEVQRKTRRS